MNHHRRHAVKVRLGDVLDKLGVGHVAKTLVMHDHVVALGPVGFFVNAHAMVPDDSAPRTAALEQDVPGDVGARADAFRQDRFLRHIIVAAAAGDEEGVNGFDRAHGLRAGQNQEG